MATVINTKMGESRGHRRIWLEGRKLAREGYQPGMKYDAVAENGRVVLRVAEAGHYTVSRRTRSGYTLPIIDLTADTITKAFDGVAMLRVAVKRGTIVITAHASHGTARRRVERLHDRLANGQPLDVVSLFHGGGVLDKAMHAGFAAGGIKTRLMAAVECESAYLDASLANNPELWDADSTAIQSPVEAVTFHGAPEVDVVTAGIPCTGASKSGRTKNKLAFAEGHPEAGAMFFSFLQCVQALNPALVVLENVPEYGNTASMAVIRSVLATLQYRVHERVLEGNAFGCLERRSRLCVVAVAEGIGAGFDVASILPDREKEPALSAVLDQIPDDSPRWKDFSYLADKEGRDRAAGKGFARQLLSGEAEHCGTIGRHYAKCRSTEPFVVHPADESRSRLLTPAEHCRVKGIPEAVIAGLSDTMAHQILGQSVIFPAFRAVGRAVAAHIGRVLTQPAAQVA